MQHLVTPLLYTEVAEAGCVRRLPMFLRTVLGNPDLAQRVKSFSGRTIQSHWFQPSDYVGSLKRMMPRIIDISIWSPEDKVSIQTAIENATKTFKLAYYTYPTRSDETFSRRWIKKIFKASYFATWDTTVALLLCLLPNLEVFRVQTFKDHRQHHRDGVAGFQFIMRILQSSKTTTGRLILPRLRTADLSFRDCVLRKRLHYSLCHTLAPLKCFRYEVFPVMDTWKDRSHRCREADVNPAFVRTRLLSGLEQSVEELSIIIRLLDPELLSKWRITKDTRLSHCGIGSLRDFTQLRVLKMTARILIGNPAHDQYLANMSFEDMMLRYKYIPEQENSFYQGLPSRLEALHIIDCPNAVYGCIKRLLQTSFLPSTLKRIELTYTYPTRDREGRALAAMNKWLAGENAGWCLMFPGESFATKKYLESLASEKGITAIQRIDENYRDNKISTKW